MDYFVSVWKCLISISLILRGCNITYGAQENICGFPGSPAYGNVRPDQDSYKEDDVVSYSCRVGYILLGATTRSCDPGGIWSGDVPICDESITTLGSANSTPTVPGFNAEMAIDRNKQTCAYMKPNNPRFWRIDFGRPNNVLSVTVTMITTDKLVKFTVYVIQIQGGKALYNRCASFAGKFGSPTMLFNCGEGKGIEGQRVHIEDHLENKDLFEICEVEVLVKRDTGYDCGHPDREPYSITEERVGNVVEYGCVPGYKLQGSPKRFCGHTGQWSGEAPECIPIFCDLLEPLENGDIRILVTNERNLPEDTIAIYKCRKGYKLEGDFTRECLTDGSWSGGTPHCEAIRCPALDRRYYEVFRLLNKTTLMGSMAELRCKRGSKREGDNPYIYCTEDGEWTKLKSSCILPAGASMPMMEEPRIAKRGGVIFGMVVAVLMMLFIAVSFVIIKRRRDAKKPELPKRQHEEPVPPPRPPPRAKSIRSAIMDFMLRESPAPRYETLDAEAAIERPAWKTRSLPLEPGIDISNDESSAARRAFSYDGAGKSLHKIDAAGMQQESGVYETVPEENENHNENDKNIPSEEKVMPSQRSEGRGTPSQKSEGRGTPSQKSEGRGTPSQKAEGKATPPQKAQRKGTPSQKAAGRGTPSQKDEERGTPQQIASGDYAAVDYEKKRQSRLMKDQGSEETIPSTSPVMEDIPLRELPPIPTEETDSEAMPNTETTENDPGKKEQEEEDGGSEESEDVSLPIVQSDSPTSGNATPSPDVVIENQVDGIPESSTPEERAGRRARGRPADQTSTEEAPEGRRTRRVRGTEETGEPERSAPTPVAEQRPARRRPFGAERFEPASTTSQPTGRRRF